MVPAWFIEGLIMGGFWLSTGAIIAYLLRNRAMLAMQGFISGYIAMLLADITAHPEQIKPALDAVMKSVLSSPNGIMPKETMIKLPILGRVPASWFEPLIRSQLGKFAKEGVEKTAEAAGAFG